MTPSNCKVIKTIANVVFWIMLVGGAVFTAGFGLCLMISRLAALTGCRDFQIAQEDAGGSWRKFAANPVLGGEKLGTCFDVNVITNGPAPYTMYFSWRPRKAIALVRSRNAVDWTEEPEICLEANPASGWEDDVNRSCTVFRDGVWHMWYTGQSRGRSCIGYATSTNGVHFTRVRRQPVLKPKASFEKQSVMNPYVRWDAERQVWRMWYAAGETYEPNVICYAESADGIQWKKYADNPIFSKSHWWAWDRDRVGGCEVHPLPDGSWVMFYIGYSDIDTARIGCAFSPDGISGWQRAAQNPLVAPDLGTWDGSACYKPSVVRDEVHNRWLLWYNGRNGAPEYVGMAVHDGLDLGAPGAPPADAEKLLRTYVARFNAMDEELYTNAIPNAVAADFLAENVPLFSCPDRDIERTYYFRWWTYRKHLRQTADGGWAVSEFLPNVGWAGGENTIACPFGHHVREGRWLRDGRYLASYIDFMAAKGRINGPNAYCCWPARSALDYAKVTGDREVAVRNLDRFIANFERWREGWNVIGLSLRDVQGPWTYDGPVVATGFKPERGLYDYAGDREGSEFALSVDGARPLVNAAMWAEAAAISDLARSVGKLELSREYAQFALELKKNLCAKLWNPERQFFTALSVTGEHDDVCELNGYAPFYFAMPLDKSYADGAFGYLAGNNGFRAPRGLTFPLQSTRGFDVKVEGGRHECLWNGPSWPYATSIALTALAQQLQRGGLRWVCRDDFVQLLSQYAAQQRLTRPGAEGGATVPWIDENLHPYTGEWIARRVLQLREQASGRPNEPRERGKDYNHSTFCDLVIGGLVGFIPETGDAFSVDPLAPATWDYFSLERLRYHGHDVAIRWQRGQGLAVYVDGVLKAKSDKLEKLAVAL